MGAASTPTFEIRDGKEWVTFTTATGDTTSDQVSRLKGDPGQKIEPRPEWTAIAAQAYATWKADKKAQAEARKADEAKKAEAEAAAKAAEATTEPATAAPEDDEDEDDSEDVTAKPGMPRRTFAKGYKK